MTNKLLLDPEVQKLIADVESSHATYMQETSKMEKLMYEERLSKIAYELTEDDEEIILQAFKTCSDKLHDSIKDYFHLNKDVLELVNKYKKTLYNLPNVVVELATKTMPYQAYTRTITYSDSTYKHTMKLRSEFLAGNIKITIYDEDDTCVVINLSNYTERLTAEGLPQDFKVEEFVKVFNAKFYNYLTEMINGARRKARKDFITKNKRMIKAIEQSTPKNL